MLSVAEAVAAILAELQPLPVERLPLAETLGLVLAEPVISDIESPPFDKSLMDGFAVRAADVANGTATLRLIETVMAGQVPQHAVGAGETIRIMTGAPLPQGADAVVRVEDAQINGDRIALNTRPIRPGDCVLHRGTALRRGETVLPAGTRLKPQQLGALAELGCSTVPVRRRSHVAVLATGDELVPIDQTPGPGQIRNSNEAMLVAQLQAAGAVPVPLGIARDERAHLRTRILEGLKCDVLVLSGGVSAGELDLVPSELAAAGVRQVFHKVNLKPGKPVWFGVVETASADRRTAVFGLPGNPVSSMVCCELFVRTAIRRLMGAVPAEPQPVTARLTDEYPMRGDRPTYHPAHLTWHDTGPAVRLIRWHGSADLRATVAANAMAYLPAGERTYRAGDLLDVYSWE